MNRNKAAGTRWESAVVAWLAAHGFLHAERRALTGALDKGDVAGIPGVMVECKATKQITLAAFADETAAETVNAHADVGLCVIKRHGKANPEHAYVLMSMRDAAWLLRSAGYGETPSGDSA